MTENNDRTANSQAGGGQPQNPAERVKKLMDSLTKDNVSGVAHELTVHQIELEMQNDELRAAEERLEAVKHQFIDYFMAAPIAYVITDPSGKITEINQKAMQLFDGTHSRLLDKPFAHMLAAESLALFRQKCEGATTTGAVESCNLSLRTFAGASVSVRAWIMAVRPRSPYITDQFRISMLGLDDLNASNGRAHLLQTHLNQMTGELIASGEQEQTLINLLMRDMQVCMRSLEQTSQKIQDAAPSESPFALRTDAEALTDYTRRLTHLTADLLQVINTGRSAMSIKRLDLSGMITELVQELRTTQPNRLVAVTVAPGVEIRGDRLLLEVALRDLLQYAWKGIADEPDAQFAFTVDRSPQSPTYCIQRTGEPLKSEQAALLFQSYERLKTLPDSSDDYIGLALAAHIIHRHHGRIWAVPGMSAGAAFCFTVWTEK